MNEEMAADAEREKEAEEWLEGTNFIAEEDETAFLLKYEKNRKRLLKSMEDAKASRNFTKFDSIEELKEKVSIQQALR